MEVLLDVSLGVVGFEFVFGADLHVSHRLQKVLHLLKEKEAIIALGYHELMR